MPQQYKVYWLGKHGYPFGQAISVVIILWNLNQKKMLKKRKVTQNDILQKDYEKDAFSESSLSMKQHLVFDSSTDPANNFCQYFGVTKPKGVRYENN